MKLGTALQVVYLDQLRAQIDGEKTVAQNVAGDAETVNFQGRARHIHSYLGDFLFRSDRVRMPAKLLSGGERNRLLLARLFLQPANVLVLDEPTNDLDAETLELLEELLIGYDGTLLLVSHDREFLDHVVTSTLVFEAAVASRNTSAATRTGSRNGRPLFEKSAPAPEEAPKPRGKSERPRKFLNREQRELDELPGVIERLEAEHAEIAAKLADPATYQREPESVQRLQAELTDNESRAHIAYARWEELEALRLACAGN